MMSVITRPNYISNILDDGYINTSVITTKVFAYTNDLQVPQSLTLGATSNLNIETAKDINLFMGTSNAYTLYTSLYDSNADVRTDTEVLQVLSQSTSNLVVISTPSNLSLMPADLSNSYINLGNMYLTQSPDAVQVIDTNLAFFNMSKSLQISGSLSVADNIIASGSLFGRDMNVWADRSNTDRSRVGYGLHINDNDELEMIKYVKFDGKDVLKKIAVFGYGRLTSNDTSDASSNYLVFNSLGEVSVASSNGLSPIANTSTGGSGISGSNSLLTGTTKLQGNMVPLSNMMYDLGSNSLFYRDVYTSNLVVPSVLNVNGSPLIIDSTSSVSTSNAPSCAALSSTYVLASNALPIAGGTLTGALSTPSLTVTNLTTTSNLTTTGLITASNVLISGSNVLAIAQAALPLAGGTISGSLSVAGNLTVSGTTTAINTTNMTINDNIIVLNNNQTGTPPSFLRSGIEVERGDLSNYYFMFDESSKYFKVGLCNDLQAVCTRDDNLTSGYLYFDSNVQKLINRSLAVGDVSGLVSSQWSSSNGNVYYSTNFSSNGMPAATASNVGIGYSAPSYKLAVNGDIFASDDITAFSDRRLKDNITVIPNALSKVGSISGYTFTRKDRDSNKKYAGLIAQELQTVLPEVVSTDNDGYMSVAYGNVVSLLVEAIKELKGQVEELQSKVV